MEKLQDVLEKIEVNTRSTAKSNREIAQWEAFRGILTILGLVGGALGLIYVLNH